MIETSLSLLQRLADKSDGQAWGEFCRLYEPLLRGWLHRYGIQDCDADDIAQETLLALVADIRRFQHPGHSGAFRGWIRSILVNRLRASWRKRRNAPSVPGTNDFWERLDELEDPESSLSHLWNTEHDRHVLGRLLERVAPRFAEGTYGMFRRYVLENVDAAQVAAEWGVTVNAVFIAKSRVLRALRQEIALIHGPQEVFPTDGSKVRCSQALLFLAGDRRKEPPWTPHGLGEVST